MKKRKRYIKALFLFLVLFLLTGCAKKEKSDKEIISDLTQYFVEDHTSFHLQFDQVDGKVEKRQTNEKDKTDYAWVRITAENEVVNIQCLYKATYILYNDEWKLETCDTEEYTYEILKTTVTEEEAFSYVKENYINKYEEIILQNRITDISGEFGWDTFIYEASYREGLVKKYDVIEVVFEFNDVLKVWEFSNIKNNESHEEWFVKGDWECVSNENYFYVTIHEITDEYIALEYDFSYNYDSILYGQQTEKGTSDGIKNVEKYRSGDDGIGCNFYADLYLSIDKDEISIRKKGYGDSVYFVLKKTYE